MPDKQHLLAALRAESERWQALLASLDEEQLTLEQARRPTGHGYPPIPSEKRKVFT